MDHLKNINSPSLVASIDLMIKLTGRYYTHEIIAKNGIRTLINEISKKGLLMKSMKIVDPFGGDGRLVYWFLKEWKVCNLPSIKWQISVWDIDETGLTVAENYFNELKSEGFELEYTIICNDSFKIALEHSEEFDLVITNPPWEILKPDRRELNHLNEIEKKQYITSLKNYDSFVTEKYPLSQPKTKFAGWGTNLSRVGLEIGFKILKKGGNAMIVLPGSIFADEQSSRLRKYMFENCIIFDISFYPAEVKLFKNADTSCSNIVFMKTEVESSKSEVCLSLFDKNVTLKVQDTINITSRYFKKNGYVIPISLGPSGLKLLEKFNYKFNQWGTLENNSIERLWAGREMDETRSQDWLGKGGSGPSFIKGKMINRFKIKETPSQNILKKNWIPPASSGHEKIVWRDVSRPNQKRRIIATIIPQDIIAGNSLGVCYYKDKDKSALRILLGIMNSLCFEFQLRAHLATGHISLSSIRKVCVPDRAQFYKYSFIENQVEKALEGDLLAEFKIEAYVARIVYELTIDEYCLLLKTFEKLSEEEKIHLVNEFKSYD
jgi:Alw26I/Eco31I/Esp3I family type II restriction m6 adenine DNA methyltransferase